MTTSPAPSVAPWRDALRAAALLALDPVGLGGVRLRARPGPARDAWLAALTAMLPDGLPLRRMPAGIAEERLLGGLDLAATLAAGRPVQERGLLAETAGGILTIAMAERVERGTAGQLTTALDRGAAAGVGLLLLDEGDAPDEAPPPALTDRVAIHLALDAVDARTMRAEGAPARLDLPAARGRLATMGEAPDAVTALCATAVALGIDSLRAPLLALRVARAAAALAGRDMPADADLQLAARLVLAPRATCLPADVPPEQTTEPPPDRAEDPSQDASDREPDSAEAAPLEDRVLAAALAALPPGLLAALMAGGAGAARARPGGAGAGDTRLSPWRGRPLAARPGDPRRQGRLDLIATLRAAAPWQPLRRPARAGRLAVRAGDLRVRRHVERRGTTAIFAVDASGSAALHRLAEVKGAIERLLGDCYARRDQVALIAFRGTGAALLLPPTAALARARRCLAALPGGGGTPLAAGLDAAAVLADATRRQGRTPLLVVLTDGRANVARDGTGGRPRAAAEAAAAAEALRVQAVPALLIDIAPRPDPAAAALAGAMGARYLPLPFADAAALSGAVRGARAATV